MPKTSWSNSSNPDSSPSPYPMKITQVILLTHCLVSLLLSGCAARTIVMDPNAPSRKGDVVTAGLDHPDLARVAREMLESLRSRGVLEKSPRQPALLGISRFRNDTGLHIDLDIDKLVGDIRADLTRDGKVEIEPFYRVGGRPEDPLVYEQYRKDRFLKSLPERDPDFNLSGTVIINRARQERKTLNTYTFQFRLTSNTTFTQVWQESAVVQKISERPLF